MINVEQIGIELWTALQRAEPVDPLSTRFNGMTLADAYEIQREVIRLRVAAGARLIGKKIGVTSRAVMDMLGVDQPDFGMLTDDMVYPEGSRIPIDGFIQPRIEGELAFVFGRRLQGPGVSVADILRVTEGVMPCFEIVDSRIRDWKIQIEDTVADNASCGAFVLGGRMVRLDGLDLATCGMVLQRNGEVVVTGAGAATMDSPVNAVAWLVNTLGRLGVAIEAGEVILSGALGAMIPVKAGDSFHLSIGGVGTCTTRFEQHRRSLK